MCYKLVPTVPPSYLPSPTPSLQSPQYRPLLGHSRTDVVKRAMHTKDSYYEVRQHWVDGSGLNAEGERREQWEGEGAPRVSVTYAGSHPHLSVNCRWWW